MAIPWKEQWTTYSGAFVSPNAVLTKDELVELLKPIVSKAWKTSQKPAVAYVEETLDEVGWKGTGYTTVENGVKVVMNDETGEAIIDGPYKNLDSDSYLLTPKQRKQIGTMTGYPRKQYVTLFKWNLRTRDEGIVTPELVGALRAELRASNIGKPDFSYTSRADKGLVKAPTIPAAPKKEDNDIPKPPPAKESKPLWGLLAAIIGGLTVLKRG